MAKNFDNSLDFARELDRNDPMKRFREQFIIPQINEREQVYFLGNSLGLQPVSTSAHIQFILKDWADQGVESFFNAREPWLDYHDQLRGPLATIVGALPQEIVVMNQLTVNLHLMMVSFYRPTAKRFRVICEAKAFPSDQYALETHVKFHGFDPGEAIIEVTPREGENLLREEDIINTIDKYKDSLALVLFGGINYYTGQLFDLASVSRAARAAGAFVGFDLAHAAGNVALQLHDWGADFACWCNYKYLNAGPGAIGAVYIHEKHHHEDLPRFAGWWGYDKPTRFRMEKGFVPMPGAEGWQLSTPSILLYASLRASLEIFGEAGWSNILAKQKLMNDYLWFMLDETRKINGLPGVDCITPREAKARGSQVSLLIHSNGKALFDALTERDIMVDWREPGVIRLAPVPLYNSFEEIWYFANTLQQILNQ